MKVIHRNEGYTFGDDPGEQYSCKYENKIIEINILTQFKPFYIEAKKCGCFWGISNLEYLEYCYDNRKKK